MTNNKKILTENLTEQQVTSYGNSISKILLAYAIYVDGDAKHGRDKIETVERLIELMDYLVREVKDDFNKPNVVRSKIIWDGDAVLLDGNSEVDELIVTVKGGE